MLWCFELFHVIISAISWEQTGRRFTISSCYVLALISTIFGIVLHVTHIVCIQRPCQSLKCASAVLPLLLYESAFWALPLVIIWWTLIWKPLNWLHLAWNNFCYLAHTLLRCQYVHWLRGTPIVKGVWNNIHANTCKWWLPRTSNSTNAWVWVSQWTLIDAYFVRLLHHLDMLRRVLDVKLCELICSWNVWQYHLNWSLIFF